MPRFGVSTICFGPDANACEVLDFAVQHGFQGYELSSYHFWPERLHADEVRRILIDSGPLVALLTRNDRRT